MKLPKLNLATGSDDLRPGLNYIHINMDTQKVYATNAHILVRHDLDSLLGEYAELFTENCGIKAADWKQLTTEFTNLELVQTEGSANNMLKVTKKNGITLLTLHTEYNNSDLSMKITKSIDNLIDTTMAQECGGNEHVYNVDLLYALKQAMSTVKESPIRITKKEHNTHIVEAFITNGSYSDSKSEKINVDGVIMGMALTL